MSKDSASVTLCLCGDVMTGRGIDQVLPTPSDPQIYESYVKRATRYVELAERANGPIPRAVPFDYPWGDALEELDRLAPDATIVNLETAVTRSDDYWRGKGINYRMHPANVAVLTAAGFDCCALANNHVLDWGYPGLEETLETLRRARLKAAGAGRHRRQAEAPAILELSGQRRVLVISLGLPSSGIPLQWAAANDQPGINLARGLDEATVERLTTGIERARRPGDLVVLSIHWGSNWGYGIPGSHRWFARRVIDQAGVDVVHGHSSHHPLGIEVYQGRPILYGCGDFLNDYEGIGGYEEFKSDLALLYVVSLEAATGRLLELTMSPFQIRRFRAQRASRDDAAWLRDTLSREGESLGTEVTLGEDGSLALRW